MGRDPDTLQNSSNIALELHPVFPYYYHSKELQKHLEWVESVLIKIFPEDILKKEQEDFLMRSRNALPIVRWTSCTNTPDCISVFLLCRPLW